MIGPIKTVAVYVEDQERAEAFYTGPLGFVVRRRSDGFGGEAGSRSVRPGASCVVLLPRAMTPDWASKKPSVVFHCPDVEATCLETR
jgi:catechol 2,3-dioxygenase-like lactoylglutathione lyase family enzyme